MNGDFIDYLILATFKTRATDSVEKYTQVNKQKTLQLFNKC